MIETSKLHMQIIIRKYYTSKIQFLVCDKLYLYFQVNFNISVPKSKLGSIDPERYYCKILRSSKNHWLPMKDNKLQCRHCRPGCASGIYNVKSEA